MRLTSRPLPIHLMRTVGRFANAPPFAFANQRNVSRIPDSESEQTHTAARPSRILTAFPFDYPGAHRPGTCKLGYFLVKERTNHPIPDHLSPVNPKNPKFSPPFSRRRHRGAPLRTSSTPRHNCLSNGNIEECVFAAQALVQVRYAIGDTRDSLHSRPKNRTISVSRSRRQQL